MRRTWPVHEAETRFGELLEASLNDGPQVVSQRGVDTAVLVPIEQWRRLEKGSGPTLKDLLLAAPARSDALVPPRGAPRHRSPTAID